MEMCILIGVEDLSRIRCEKKMLRNKLAESSSSSQPDSTNGGSCDTSDPLSSVDVDEWEFELDFTLKESMSEMRELIKTAGLSFKGEISQRLQEVNPVTHIGTGKVAEVKEL